MSAVPLNNHAIDHFKIYLPEKGEFRVLLETCDKIKLKDISFKTELTEKDKRYPPNLV